MNLPFAQNLENALAKAYKFSITNKLYYLDSTIIGLGILESDFPLPEINRQKIINVIRSMYTTASGFDFSEENIPLTLEAECMIKNAGYYREVLNDDTISCTHVILSLLSFENHFKDLMYKEGLVFSEYSGSITINNNLKVISKKSPQRNPVRIRGYRRFEMLFLSQSRKKRLVDNYIQEAVTFYRFNDYNNCLNTCRRILELSKKNQTANELSGISCMRKKKYSMAIDYFLKILASKEDDINTLIIIAHSFNQMGDYENAEMYYLKAIKLEPNSTTILNNLGFVHLNKGKYKEAIDLFDKTIAADKDFAYPYNNKGFCLLKLGSIDQAKEYILKSLELDRGNSFAYKNLALVFLQEGGKDEAINMLNKALRFEFTEHYGEEVNELLAGLVE